MHMVTNKNGVWCISYNIRNGLPWHKRGQGHDGPMTVEQALALSHAGFVVEEFPVFLEGGKQITSHKALVRTDTMGVLGVVGQGYGKILYSDWAKTIAAPFESPEVVDTMGVLGDEGERFFMSISLEDQKLMGDSIARWLTATTSHNGTEAATLIRTSVRAVCNNTVTAALNRAPCRYVVRHTRNANLRVQQMGKILAQAQKDEKVLSEAFEALSKKSVTTRSLMDLLPKMVPPVKVKDSVKPMVTPKVREARNRIAEYLEGPETVVPKGRSRWSLYNALCAYVDRDQGRVTEQDRTLRSRLSTAAEETRSRALEVLLAV